MKKIKVEVKAQPAIVSAALRDAALRTTGCESARGKPCPPVDIRGVRLREHAPHLTMSEQLDQVQQELDRHKAVSVMVDAGLNMDTHKMLVREAEEYRRLVENTTVEGMSLPGIDSISGEWDHSAVTGETATAASERLQKRALQLYEKMNLGTSKDSRYSLDSILMTPLQRMAIAANIATEEDYRMAAAAKARSPSQRRMDYLRVAAIGPRFLMEFPAKAGNKGVSKLTKRNQRKRYARQVEQHDR